MFYASLTRNKTETETDEQGDQSPGRGAFKEPWIFHIQLSFRSSAAAAEVNATLL